MLNDKIKKYIILNKGKKKKQTGTNLLNSS